MRRRSPERLVAAVLVTALVAFARPVAAEPATPAPDAASPPDTTPAADGKPAADAKPSTGFLTLNATRSKEPITITSDNLEYQYDDGVIIYRGDVLAVQGEVKVKSNELRITLVKDDDNKKVTAKAATQLDSADSSKLQTVVATGSVRIDQGTRWAVAGKATFEQSKRTLVLTENPVVHDGPNEVMGDRIVVYIDENRSVVEGGPKRVKAMLIPGKKDGSAGPKPAKPGTTEVASPGTTR
jgi:lipopolysaccharide export system protein LptA